MRCVSTDHSTREDFKEAPQNTQIIVIIVVGTVAILPFGFVLFLIVS